MTLKIETVHSLESRKLELPSETVQADYSSSSVKAIKENILRNFGFWSKLMKVGGALTAERAAGHDALARMGASLARKPMGAEGEGVLKVLERVNGKSMGVADAMTEIGKLERQYAASHTATQNAEARAFFATARKVVLMAPAVAGKIPAKMRDAQKAVADISAQYDRLEHALSADTLHEVDDLRSIYNWQLGVARQAGDSELADALQMIVSVLDGKHAMLQELANVSARLSQGIPDARTMQDAGAALEAMAQACLVSYGSGGELHDLGKASLIGAVQSGLTGFYGAMHRQDMARVAELQSQLDQIDFANDLTVDWTSVDGLTDEVSSIGDKMYTQEMLDEGAAALQKLNQSANMKSLVVRLRTLECDFASGKSVGNAPLQAILRDLGKVEVPAHETTTRDAIEFHARKLWDDMNAYSAERVRTPLAALRKELEVAKGVEQARECGRRIEAELKAQLEFLLEPDTPVSPQMLETLRTEMKSLSGAAIRQESRLVMESIAAEGRHTLQELADSLASQAHLDQDALQAELADIKDTSRENQGTAIARLADLEKHVRSFSIGSNPQADTVLAQLQTLAEVVSTTRAKADSTMLAEEKTAVEAKCVEVEKQLAQRCAEAMNMLPGNLHFKMVEPDMKAVGEICRLGGFDAKLANAILKLGNEDLNAFRALNTAVNKRLDGQPGTSMELFAQLDKLLDMDPEIADALLQVKLKLAPGMDAKKVRLLHDAAVARNSFERTMAEPSKNLSMERLGLYYFKNVTTRTSLRYMLGKIGLAGRNRPNGLNMAILRHLWQDELTRDATDDSPLPDVKARFERFQSELPEPFKSDRDLFGALAFDAKELRFVEDFGKSLAALSATMDGAKELQAAFDACAGQDDVFAARKALESLTRRYANCTSATGDQLMQSGASVRKGLFAACEKLPDELALAFQIGGEPTEEQLAQMEAFAEKAEGLRSASVLLTARAKRQQVACAAIVGDVASYDKTIRAVKTADGEPFKPKKVTGATIAVCILAMQTAVKGIEHDLNTELHAPDEAERQAAAKRMQARYDLLMRTHFPEGMKLSIMTSRFQVVMDEQAEELDRLRRQARDLPDGDATAAKRRLVEIAKEIERFLADGKYVDKALAVLAFKRQDSKGSAQKVWDRALDHAKLSTPDFALAREMMFKLFPQEIAGKGVRANIAESQLTVAAKKDFEAAKKSLDETTRAFGGQVRKALSDAVQIAVADTFLRSDPPLGSVAELRKQILAMPDQRALRESPFFRQCQKTLREKLAVPDSVSTNLLIQFFASMDDHVFQDMVRGAGVQGAQSFLMDLSAADRAPVERLLHREDTLRRTSALVSSMTEPDAMVTFSLGMTRGTVRSAVAGRVFSGERRREQALEAGMTIRREGAEFVLTLSPYAAGNMGKRVAEALVKLENAAARGGQYRDGLELHFESGGKCADFLADLLSGELEMASFQRCSGIDLLARKGLSLESQRVNIVS